LVLLKTLKAKDRIVPLSTKILEMLRDFIKYTSLKRIYLKDKLLVYNMMLESTISIETAKKNGIKKPATLHWSQTQLRNSFIRKWY
jgi:integrase/recombinase XerD